jgi:hypothetical protein
MPVSLTDDGKTVHRTGWEAIHYAEWYGATLYLTGQPLSTYWPQQVQAMVDGGEATVDDCCLDRPVGRMEMQQWYGQELESGFSGAYRAEEHCREEASDA